MAQTVRVLLTCDYDEKPTVAVETVTFGHNGVTYEADMCQVHLDEYNNWIGDYVAHSRKISGGRTRHAATRKAGVSPAQAGRRGGDDLVAIREWGRANGFAVSDRGRISGSVRAAYEAAQQ
jgi:hypothetical protein